MPVPLREDSAVQRLRRAVYRRMLRQLRTSISSLGEGALLDVVEAPSLAESVARVVSAAPEAAAGADEGWAEELLRGAAAMQALLRDAGGCYAPGDVAKLLGITPQAVHQRRRRRALLAVPLAKGEWGFPVRQFGASGRVFTHLPRVLQAFPDEADAWTQLSILLAPQPWLNGDAALDHLDDAAAADAAAELARTYGEQGAA